MHLLVPFPGEQDLPWRVEASLERGSGGRLDAAFRLSGRLDGLALPESSGTGSFRDELWRTTCLEVFLQLEGGKGYVEWNLSLSGDWACYLFSDYRRRERRLREAPRISIRRSKTSLIELRAEFASPFRKAGALRAGLCAVLEGTSGALSHWALRQPPPDSRFSRRGGLRLSGPLRAPAGRAQTPLGPSPPPGGRGLIARIC